jgi:putative nucleotidyltransferase with HDIG domain
MMRETGVLARVLPEIDRCAGVSQNEHHPDDVFIHSAKACDQVPRSNLVVRWAALLHDIGKVDRRQTVHDEKLGDRVVFYGHQAASAEATVRVLRRLRYRNALVKKCEALVRYHMFNYEPAWKAATVRRFIRRVGETNLEGLFLLRQADVRSRDPDSRLDDLRDLRRRVSEELARRSALKISDLAIDGEDVMRLCGCKPGPWVGKLLGEALEAVLEDPTLNERNRLTEWVRKRSPKSRKPA